MKKIIGTLLVLLALIVPANAATINVPAGGDLQAAINAAQPGDVIALAPGVTYIGNFFFPAKAGMVTLTTAGTLPARRVGPADAPILATIGSAFGTTAMDMTGAVNWTVDGLRFLPIPGGFNAIVAIERGRNIMLRRLLLDVPDPQEQKRFVLGNGVNITLTQSYCSGVWRSGQDSQCFTAWEGAGPYTITDNFLEAASENVMFGGADSSSLENIPSDILVENNYFSKRLAWKGLPRNVKNLFELKAARRVIVRNNVFERNWADGQAGRSIVLTPRNQDGTAPFTVVEDVLFERNIIRDVALGFNITGHDDLALSQQTNRIVIRDNHMTVNGMAFLVWGHIGRLEIYRNTVVMPEGSVLLSFDYGSLAPGVAATYAVDSFLFAENTAPGTWIHSPVANGLAAFDIFARTYSLTLGTEPAPVPEPQPEPQPEPEPTPTPQPPPASEVTLLEARIAALEAKLQALLNYMALTPSNLKIQQLIQYFKAVPR